MLAGLMRFSIATAVEASPARHILQTNRDVLKVWTCVMEHPIVRTGRTK